GRAGTTIEIVGRRAGHEEIVSRTAGGVLDVGVGIAIGQAAGTARAIAGEQVDRLRDGGGAVADPVVAAAAAIEIVGGGVAVEGVVATA
ncbi:hypothetical protein ACPXBS_26095, partial [Escherichia coli]|uniref:hypothetical protein n=1 Tax=Escherichia coli TaxID=562 RepID=UPI003CE59C9F